MYKSLRQLTEALQNLERNRREGVKPVEFPRNLPVSNFVIPDEITAFLERRRLYFEKTRNVSVGYY